MRELDTYITRMSELAPKLSQASDSLTAMILELEKRIERTKIGIEVWLQRPFAQESAPAGEGPAGEREGDEVVRGELRYVIGWARVGERWRIVYKRLRTDHRAAGSSRPIPQEVQEGNVEPLSNAPRWLRIDAASHLLELVGELVREAERYIAAIEAVEAQVNDPDR